MILVKSIQTLDLTLDQSRPSLRSEHRYANLFYFSYSILNIVIPTQYIALQIIGWLVEPSVPQKSARTYQTTRQNSLRIRFHGIVVFVFKIFRTVGGRKVLFLTAPDEMYVRSVTLSWSCHKSAGGAKWLTPCFSSSFYSTRPSLSLPHQAALVSTCDSRHVFSPLSFLRLHYLSRIFTVTVCFASPRHDLNRLNAFTRGS